MYTAVRNQCLDAILNVNRDKANAIIEEWISLHGYEQILESILDPILEELGRLWNLQGDISYAQV